MKRTPLRSRPPADHRSEPGYREWKTPAYGECQVCGARGLLVRHHVILEQHVRAIPGGDPWDLRNSILVGALRCSCHRDHHAATRRLPRALLPPEAIAFAVELLGGHQAADYLNRYYDPDGGTR